MAQNYFGVLTLLSPLLLAGPGSGLAAEDPAAAECSPGTLRGTYLFAFSGLTATEGAPSRYAVDGTRYDLFIAPDGSTFVFVHTNPGKIAAGFERGAPRSWWATEMPRSAAAVPRDAEVLIPPQYAPRCTKLVRSPSRKSKSQPLSACSTWSWNRRI